MKRFGRYLIDRKWFKALFGEWFIQDQATAIITLTGGMTIKVPANRVRFE